MNTELVSSERMKERISQSSFHAENIKQNQFPSCRKWEKHSAQWTIDFLAVHQYCAVSYITANHINSDTCKFQTKPHFGHMFISDRFALLNCNIKEIYAGIKFSSHIIPEQNTHRGFHFLWYFFVSRTPITRFGTNLHLKKAGSGRRWTL